MHPDSQQIWAVSSLSSGVKTVQPDSLQPVGFKTNSVLVLKLCSQRLPVRPPVEHACHCGSIGIGPIFIWLCGTMFCGIAGAGHHLLKGFGSDFWEQGGSQTGFGSDFWEQGGAPRRYIAAL